MSLAVIIRHYNHRKFFRCFADVTFVIAHSDLRAWLGLKADHLAWLLGAQGLGIWRPKPVPKAFPILGQLWLACRGKPWLCWHHMHT
jgi:hypothetical protein